MIIDSSAVIAMVRREPEADDFVELVGGEQAPVRISAANYLEAAIVVDRDPNVLARRRFDALVDDHLTIEAVSVDQVEVARAAYRDFGRGSGHPAQLNFGDCFAYALATTSREALLFKGDDFGHTDVRPAKR